MDKYDTAKSAPSNGYADSGEAPQNEVGLPFEPGTTTRDGRFLFVKNPSPLELVQIHEMAVKELGPNVTTLDVVKSVYRYNPISFWGIFKSSDETRKDAELAAFTAFLPLNDAGKAAFEAGTMDLGTPDLALLAKAGEEPKTFYLWAMVTLGTGNTSYGLIARAIGVDLFERTPFVGWASTQSAVDAIKGSSKTRDYADAKLGSSFAITFPEEYRAKIRAMPIIEGKRPVIGPKHRLETMVVSTADQLAKVMAIRAAVFMIEQHCPYEEEFDGNDYAGGYILGLVDGEPAAVMRIRYFAEFVKFERFAVVPRYRRTLIARKVMEQGIDLCRRKGYRKMYGQAQRRLVSFWKRFGFAPVPGDRRFVFSDHEYVEIAAEFEPHPDRLTMASDPFVLIRPEGDWERPGVLDKSAKRPPTNPH
jgi:predicted GNAT family N-acyltransferase